MRIVFQNFHLNESFKNEIEDTNEKIYSRFSYKVYYKSDFTAYGIHRDKLLLLEFVSQLIF